MAGTTLARTKKARLTDYDQVAAMARDHGVTLGIEPINVLGLVTFYPGLRQKAPGKYHIRVCRTLSCAMGGSYELMNKLCELAGIDRAQTSHHNPVAVSPCGTWSVEFAECLASCGTGPVCLVNDDFHEDIPAKKAKTRARRRKPKPK